MVCIFVFVFNLRSKILVSLSFSCVKIIEQKNITAIKHIINKIMKQLSLFLFLRISLKGVFSLYYIPMSIINKNYYFCYLINV